MKHLIVTGPIDCCHPWSSQAGWESVDITHGTQEQYDKTIKDWVLKGFDIWIDGHLEGTNIPSAYLIRKK